MKKKLLSTILSATMAAAMLAGCGSSDNADTQTPSSDTQAEAQTPAADTQTHRHLHQTHRRLLQAPERFTI